MKFFSLCVLISFSLSASSQVPADAPLPTNGESTAAPAIVDPPPVQDKQEFSNDIDDFEKKLSKEVPPEKPGRPATGEHATEKARAQMKKQLNQDAPPETGIAKHKKEKAAKRAEAKKTAKSKKGKKAAKSSAKKPAKKSPKKKKTAE